MVLRGVLETPALQFFIAFSILWMFRSRLTSKPWSIMAAVVSLSGMAAMLLLGCLNIMRPGFLWGDEQNILGVAAVWLKGGVMYHDPKAPELYSMLYGPYTFLVYAGFLRFTESLGALKIGLLAAHIGILIGLYLLLRRSVGRVTALGLLGAGLMVLLPQGATLYGLRADCWLLLALTWAMVAALEGSGTVTAACAGLLLGVALDFKLTVGFVVLGILAVVYARQHWRGLSAAIVGTAVAAVAPFLMPRISLGYYLWWLGASRHQGFEVILFPVNVLFAALLLLPPLIVRVARGGGLRMEPEWAQYRLAGLLFAAGMLAAIVTGAKNGAGVWHLWPLVPVSVTWLGWEAGRMKELAQGAAALVVIALAAGVINLRYFCRILPNMRVSATTVRRDREAEAELRELTVRYPQGRLTMGYVTDATDERTSESYLLVLRGQEYVVDVNAAAEEAKARVPMAPALVQRIHGCEDLWLIPHGGVPFSTQPVQPLPWTRNGIFPAGLETDFAQNHHVVQEGQYLDVWGCGR
jgi:hypothetical protein